MYSPAPVPGERESDPPHSGPGVVIKEGRPTECEMDGLKVSCRGKESTRPSNIVGGGVWAVFSGAYGSVSTVFKG